MEKNLKNSIKSLINNLCKEDYSRANKDLHKIVEYKLKKRINKAYKKDLF